MWGEREKKDTEEMDVMKIETEERIADSGATTRWLIPFNHTKHCAFNADKKTVQKGKKKDNTGNV